MKVFSACSMSDMDTFSVHSVEAPRDHHVGEPLMRKPHAPPAASARVGRKSTAAGAGWGALCAAGSC
jgi:hypothetical protein